MKAKMARFYGWTDFVLCNMGVSKFMEYWNAITPIEAQETLLKFTISDYPQLKQTKRAEIHNDMQRQIRDMIKTEDNGPAKSNKDLAKILAEKLCGN